MIYCEFCNEFVIGFKICLYFHVLGALSVLYRGFSAAPKQKMTNSEAFVREDAHSHAQSQEVLDAKVKRKMTNSEAFVRFWFTRRLIVE